MRKVLIISIRHPVSARERVELMPSMEMVGKSVMGRMGVGVPQVPPSPASAGGEYLEGRRDLPIWCHRSELVEAVRISQVVLVVGTLAVGRPLRYHSLCTYGVLLRSLMGGDTILSSLTHIILDEIHERDGVEEHAGQAQEPQDGVDVCNGGHPAVHQLFPWVRADQPGGENVSCAGDLPGEVAPDNKLLHQGDGEVQAKWDRQVDRVHGGVDSQAGRDVQ